MMASEIIKELEKQIEKHGDLPVWIPEDNDETESAGMRYEEEEIYQYDVDHDTVYPERIFIKG